jgi:hypothetical protein
MTRALHTTRADRNWLENSQQHGPTTGERFTREPFTREPSQANRGLKNLDRSAAVKVHGWSAKYMMVFWGNLPIPRGPGCPAVIGEEIRLSRSNRRSDLIRR